MIPFVGTAPVLVALCAAHWAGAVPTDTTSRVVVTAAAALYGFGCLGVTRAVNVPMNERLDTFDPASDDGAAYWRHYVRLWTRWNHLRTAACLAASALLVAGTR